MKLLIIGDLHGRKPRIHFKDFDAIVCVGDVCDDREFRPYIKKWFRFLKKSEEKISLSTFLENDLGGKGVKKLDTNSLIGGRNILKFLNSFGKPVFIVPGNWDQSYGKTRIKDPDKDDYSYLKSFYDYYLGTGINPRLIRGLKNVRDCQYQLHSFEGVNFLGYGLSSTPENPSERKKRRKTINKEQYKKLKKRYAKYGMKLKKALKKKSKGSVVFLTHNVPYNIMDKVKDRNSPAYGKHLGSTVARDFVMKHKPLLCIGGHMHEHFGKKKLGKTTVINAGFGKDANVLVEISDDGKKLKKVKFYKGYKKK
ncbi:MAG: metallophosphoesterase [Nanoarchaeota archaeon]